MTPLVTRRGGGEAAVVPLFRATHARRAALKSQIGANSVGIKEKWGPILVFFRVPTPPPKKVSQFLRIMRLFRRRRQELNRKEKGKEKKKINETQPDLWRKRPSHHPLSRRAAISRALSLDFLFLSIPASSIVDSGSSCSKDFTGDDDGDASNILFLANSADGGSSCAIFKRSCRENSRCDRGDRAAHNLVSVNEEANASVWPQVCGNS